MMEQSLGHTMKIDLSDGIPIQNEAFRQHSLGHIMEIDLSDGIPIQDEAFRSPRYRPRHLVPLRVGEVPIEESPQSRFSTLNPRERSPSTDSRPVMHS